LITHSICYWEVCRYFSDGMNIVEDNSYTWVEFSMGKKVSEG